MEWEGIYNYIVVAIVVVILIASAYLLVIKPATDKTQEQKNFEDQLNLFLSRYCSNMNYKNFTIGNVEGTLYNFKCYSEVSPNVITTTYGRYSYTKQGTNYTFFVEQIRK